MRAFRKKYILVIGLTLFVTTLGTNLYPNYVRLKAKLTNEFDLTYKGASLAFNESVSSHINLLDYNFDDAVSRLQQALNAQAEELDGYLSRISQGESDVTVKVSNIFETAYKDNICPAIVDFTESYEEELANLEDGLLISLNGMLSLDSVQNEFKELGQFALRIKDMLRSPKGLIIKVLDDGFEWVPIAGDVWGFLKIVYDPRKENIENKIVEITESLSFGLKRRFARYRTFTASHVERVCKDSFDGNYAVIRYLYLTYFRR